MSESETEREIERLRAYLWKYGKHLTSCAARGPLGVCNCGWIEIRATLAGDAARPDEPGA
jgi:hypothetical protein